MISRNGVVVWCEERARGAAGWDASVVVKASRGPGVGELFARVSLDTISCPNWRSSQYTLQFWTADSEDRVLFAAQGVGVAVVDLVTQKTHNLVIGGNVSHAAVCARGKLVALTWFADMGDAGVFPVDYTEDYGTQVQLSRGVSLQLTSVAPRPPNAVRGTLRAAFYGEEDLVAFCCRDTPTVKVFRIHHQHPGLVLVGEHVRTLEVSWTPDPRAVGVCALTAVGRRGLAAVVADLDDLRQNALVFLEDLEDVEACSAGQGAVVSTWSTRVDPPPQAVGQMGGLYWTNMSHDIDVGVRLWRGAKTCSTVPVLAMTRARLAWLSACCRAVLMREKVVQRRE
jgi:hypothetical protein